MIERSFFKNLTVLAAVLCLGSAALSFGLGAFTFGAGVLIGGAWIFLNSYFLFRLVNAGLEPKARMNDRILLFSILKFPVLYVAGFFILKARVYPIYGILAGLTVFMIAFIISWFRFNWVPKTLSRAQEAGS